MVIVDRAHGDETRNVHTEDKYCRLWEEKKLVKDNRNKNLLQSDRERIMSKNIFRNFPPEEKGVEK